MFGPFGFQEVLIVLVIALLLFGPRRLPEIGRTLGKGLAELRKATNDFKRTINTELEAEETEIARERRPTRRAEPVEPVADRDLPQETIARGPSAGMEPRAEAEVVSAAAASAVGQEADEEISTEASGEDPEQQDFEAQKLPSPPEVAS